MGSKVDKLDWGEVGVVGGDIGRGYKLREKGREKGIWGNHP